MSKQATAKKETVSAGNSVSIYDKYVKGRELPYLLLLVAVACYIIYSDFISGKKIFLFKDIGSDTINMNYPLLLQYSEYMKSIGVPSWTFSQGMGQNLYPMWLSDPFSVFIMLFGKDVIPKLIVYMEIVKIFLTAITFYVYLRELKLSSLATFIGALLYSFSGYVILGGTWNLFSTEALYVAIILLGFERWLKESKWLFLMLGILLMALLQPFYLFSYTIFLAAYSAVRYNDVRGSWKGFIGFLFKTAGIAALGVAISAFQLLPDILMIIESPRVGGEAGLTSKLKMQPMFQVADKLLRFTTTFRAFGSDAIGTGNNFRGWSNYLEAPLFYCGILSLLTFPHMFSSLSKRQRIFYGVLTFVFVLPILFPYFRYAYWAFTGDYFRNFNLVIVVFLIYYTTNAITFFEKGGKINVIVLAVTALFLLLLLYTPPAEFRAGVDNDRRNFAAFLVLAYSVLLYLLGGKQANSKFTKIALVVICFFEILILSITTINKRDSMWSRELKEKVGYNDYTVDAINFIKSKDGSFYRVQKDYFSGLAIHGSLNDAKAQGYFGTTSYHSFNQKNYIKFLGDFNIIDVKDENSTRWAKGLGERPLLFSLASGKYWLSKRPDNYLPGFGYDSIAKFGDVKVFRNRYSLPFGFTYKKIVSFTDFKKLSSFQKDMLVLRAAVIDDPDLENFKNFQESNLADTMRAFSFAEYGQDVAELKKDSMVISSFKENKITGSVKVQAQKLLCLSIPYDEGWKAQLNGKDIHLYRINSGFTGIILDTGANEITLSYIPRLRKEGLLISLAGVVVTGGFLGFSRLLRRRKKETQETPV